MASKSEPHGIRLSARKVEIPYGEGSIALPIKKGDEVLSLRPQEHGVGIKAELNRQRDKLQAFLREHDRILIVVNDHDRPTPTAEVLVEMKDMLKLHPELWFIVATGSHRAPELSELYRIFTPEICKKFEDRIYIHDCKSHSSFDLGTTKRGTHVLMDDVLEWSDGVIAINSVEPHYFAGFTGGRKSFLPGIAAYGTIEHNHAFALSEDAANIKLDGNPVHEDMMEAADMVQSEKDVLGIQLTVGHGGKAATCHIGPLHQAFYSAVEDAKDMYCLEVEERFDTVITVANPPMDRTLYQAQKALENAKGIVKNSGTIVIVAACSDGIGNRKFYDLLKKHSEPEGVIDEVEKGYVLGYHKAARIAQAALKYDIYLQSNLSPHVVEAAHLKPCSNLQEVVHRTDGRVAIILDGSTLVPYVKE